MTAITLDQANACIRAAFAHAAEKGLKPLAAVVLDAGGQLIACQRQDGASIGRVQVATGKAGGALFLGMSSRKVADTAAERPTFVTALTSIAPHGLVPAAGGVLIVGPDDMPIGAVGISGDLSDNDEAAVLAGLAAAGLTAQS